jgi:hypothetical protein
MERYDSLAADGAAARADDRANGDAWLGTIFAGMLQAAASSRPRTGIVACRILRSAPQCHRTAAAGPPARCVACSTECSQVPPAIAIVEAQASGARLGAGICGDCAARPDRGPDRRHVQGAAAVGAVATGARANRVGVMAAGADRPVRNANGKANYDPIIIFAIATAAIGSTAQCSRCCASTLPSWLAAVDGRQR